MEEENQTCTDTQAQSWDGARAACAKATLRREEAAAGGGSRGRSGGEREGRGERCKFGRRRYIGGIRRRARWTRKTGEEDEVGLGLAHICGMPWEFNLGLDDNSGVGGRVGYPFPWSHLRPQSHLARDGGFAGYYSVLRTYIVTAERVERGMGDGSLGGSHGASGGMASGNEGGVISAAALSWVYLRTVGTYIRRNYYSQLSGSAERECARIHKQQAGSQSINQSAFTFAVMDVGWGGRDVSRMLKGEGTVSILCE